MYNAMFTYGNNSVFFNSAEKTCLRLESRL